MMLASLQICVGREGPPASILQWDPSGGGPRGTPDIGERTADLSTEETDREYQSSQRDSDTRIFITIFTFLQNRKLVVTLRLRGVRTPERLKSTS